MYTARTSIDEKILITSWRVRNPCIEIDRLKCDDDDFEFIFDEIDFNNFNHALKEQSHWMISHEIITELCETNDWQREEF